MPPSFVVKSRISKRLWCYTSMTSLRIYLETPKNSPEHRTLHQNFGGRRSVGAFLLSAFSLSQSHGEHGGVSEFPVSTFPFSPSLCLCAYERPTPPRLHGRDDHALLGRRCADEKWVMQDNDHLQCAGGPESPKCLRNSATRLKVCSREAFIL